MPTAPPSRTLLTRPAKTAASQALSPTKANTNDDGGATIKRPTTPPSPTNNGPVNYSKPPKKRYLETMDQNGASAPNVTQRVPRSGTTTSTDSAASALLELAEVCTSKANRGEKSGVGRLCQIPMFDVCTANRIIDAAFCESGSSPADLLQKVRNAGAQAQALLETARESAASQHSQPNSVTSVTASPSATHMCGPGEQPLNLCTERSKTIKTSQQDIINHIIEKFLTSTATKTPMDGKQFSSEPSPLQQQIPAGWERRPVSPHQADSAPSLANAKPSAQRKCPTVPVSDVVRGRSQASSSRRANKRASAPPSPSQEDDDSSKRVFNLEAEIAALPKCNMEAFSNRKRKLAKESADISEPTDDTKCSKSEEGVQEESSDDDEHRLQVVDMEEDDSRKTPCEEQPRNSPGSYTNGWTTGGSGAGSSSDYQSNLDALASVALSHSGR